MSAHGHLQEPASGRTRWTLRLATVASIPIRLHITLLLLLVWIAWLEFHQASQSDLMPRGSSLEWIAFIGGRALFIVGLFGCVLVHEIGHALVARGYAIRTAEILLYPFGGVARLSKMGTPMQELWISLAGPAVNLALGLALFVALSLAGVWVAVEGRSIGRLAILEHLALANLVLAGFNLIPAFPMDGGRVLRALLARRFGMARGTRAAAHIGQVFAIGIGLLGFMLGNFVLVVIALFVLLGATQEIALQNTLALLSGRTVRNVMTMEIETLPGSMSLSQAVDRIVAAPQQDFAVALEPGTVGLLTRNDLLRGLSDLGPRADVAAVARSDAPHLAPEDALQSAVERLQSGGYTAALVFAGDQLVGIFTLERVHGYLRSQSRGNARG